MKLPIDPQQLETWLDQALELDPEALSVWLGGQPKGTRDAFMGQAAVQPQSQALLDLMGAVIRAVDKGNGVYLNQTWLIEAAIVASGGILAGPALLAAFVPTTR